MGLMMPIPKQKLSSQGEVMEASFVYPLTVSQQCAEYHQGIKAQEHYKYLNWQKQRKGVIHQALFSQASLIQTNGVVKGQYLVDYTPKG